MLTAQNEECAIYHGHVVLSAFQLSPARPLAGNAGRSGTEI
jgi:hypothetical protein